MTILKRALLLAAIAAFALWSIAGSMIDARAGVLQPAVDHSIFLPMIVNDGSLRRANAPYFNVANVGDRFSEMAIFWFGRITPTENYADVRVGYNNTELYVYTSSFDRRIWYDTSPSTNDLAQWDAVTLYLSTTGPNGSQPVATSHRFDAQLSDWQPRANYQATYQGNGSSWVLTSTPFTSASGWRGDHLNDNTDDKGWAMTFHIPFVSLGLAGPPAPGTVWGLAIALHDRDDSGGAPIADKTWPETAGTNAPGTWGQLRFGLPTYTPPVVSSPAAVTIKHRLNGATVADAGVGGYTVCGGSVDYWNEWGNTNEGYYNSERSDFNIQNQSDISDWPCFSKYYVTFPLNSIPAGKTIVSATLALYQIGNSNPSLATPSLIQVLIVDRGWTDTTITWNNAPLATENVGRAWVAALPGHPGFPGVRREWDVSGAVAEAYAAGRPLRLVLYSADSDYHSGKYFVSSDTGDWNAAGRPALTVMYGNP